MDSTAVTARIDALLKRRGISKGAFYAACGISSSAYSQWNTGRTAPRPASLRRVADYLDVPYEYLAQGTGLPEPEAEPSRPVSDEDIKFALFGGGQDITDEMYDEVKRFARMVMLREEAEKRGKGL